MAALTASQAPPEARASAQQRPAPAEQGTSVSGDTPYRTELPPLRAEGRGADEGDGPVAGGTRAGALPATVFAAYRGAEEELARTAPGCRLRWQLLAAIGQVESGQARGGRVTPDGTTTTPIRGPRLDGGPFAVIRDTDGGAYDGDTAYDRAVGPMQFIPSTWARWGADANGDGRADPHNVFDAALAAGRYLCAGGRDLSRPADLDRAILGYNHSTAYLRTVRAWYAYFLAGHRVVPDGAAASEPRPEPSRREKTPSEPSAKPTARPGAGPSRTPAAPAAPASPSPAPSGSSQQPRQTPKPQLPAPEPSLDLPGDDLLPSDGPLAGNSADSVAATPSTTAATGR
ncbi:lytic transglycosylase domain-containing protein [Streptomyces sp. DH24]|uniref:lytic transglycosylase domain-containing protein n=1 Tax=Streptomyces sp. DH24 TaxID=3040123 RepID=UPI002442FEC8|nr:lytic transglycosylase domain-containing protein [Streptomyces sp. DH24]MDG9719714.1 lytic transglycosylase domain-containing protein [Streptomyces sp. DH24]